MFSFAQLRYFSPKVVKQVRTNRLAKHDWRVRSLLRLEGRKYSESGYACNAITGFAVLASAMLLVMLAQADRDVSYWRPLSRLDLACGLLLLFECAAATAPQPFQRRADARLMRLSWLCPALLRWAARTGLHLALHVRPSAVKLDDPRERSTNAQPLARKGTMSSRKNTASAAALRDAAAKAVTGVKKSAKVYVHEYPKPKDFKSALSEVDDLRMPGIMWLYVDGVASCSHCFAAILSIFNLLGIGDGVGIEILACARLFRLISLSRHYPTSEMLLDVLSQSVDALKWPFYFLLVSSVFFGAALFYAELLVAPDTTEITSLADGIYFMWVSFSTVGYGDITPSTTVGKLITSFGLAVGMIWFAMPITLVGSTFEHEWTRRSVRTLAEVLQNELLENDQMTHGLYHRFMAIDVNKSGFVDEEEFGQFLDSHSALRHLTPTQRRAIFQILDPNHDGTISYHELCNAVFPTLDHIAISQHQAHYQDNRVDKEDTTTDLLDEVSSKLVTSAGGGQQESVPGGGASPSRLAIRRDRSPSWRSPCMASSSTGCKQRVSLVDDSSTGAANGDADEVINFTVGGDANASQLAELQAQVQKGNGQMAELRAQVEAGHGQVAQLQQRLDEVLAALHELKRA